MPLFRRLPRRGFSNHAFRVGYTALNVGQLEQMFESGDVVNCENALAKGLIKKNAKRLKVLGNGELTKSLRVEAHVSASARQKIEAASGTVVTEGK